MAQCQAAKKAVSYYVGHISRMLHVQGEQFRFRAQNLRSCPRYHAKVMRAKAIAARKAYNQWLEQQRAKREAWERAMSNPTAAIMHVFGPVYGPQALRVASCESGRGVYAQNGQYLGMFQMGSYARAAYGHSYTALGQARSAYAYFVASGRDWSPWACKPW